MIVVNDNGRSYTPTVGGLANHLTTLRTNPRYEQVLDMVKRRLNGVRGVGPAVYDALHAMKKGMKDALAPQGLFEDLGLKYVGPIDGHDRAAVEQALAQAKRFNGPVIVHVITRKGFGYDPAERHEADQFHGPGPFNAETGEENPKGQIWTDVFADEMVTLGAERKDLVAITAAMMHPVGLHLFAAKYPERTFDVGIAEQHAATSAAGLAMGGLHPVVAVYATFLNRAFDQVLMDVALHRCGVTFVLDRSGVTGDDGASHNGMWDMSILQVVPGLRLAAPRDATRLRELLREAVAGRRRPDRRAVPEGSAQRRHRAGREGRRLRRAGPQRRQGRADRRASARWRRRRSRSPSGWSRRASASPWSTPGGSSRSTRRWSTSPASTGWWSASRTTGSSAAAARCCCRPSTRRAWRRRCGCTGSRRSSCDHAKRGVILERIGLTAQTLARSVVEDVTALDAGESLLPVE